MCAVSVVLDNYRNNVPMYMWTRETYEDFRDILERMKKLDERLAQPPCEDASKAEWLEHVEKRLDMPNSTSLEMTDYTDGY